MIEVTLDIDKISKRDEYIGQSTGTSVEGGALNANYREVDAVARVANFMGMVGYKYEKDWHWEDAGCDELILKVKDEEIATQLKLRW
tara:strand:- start:3020 stop:3280 length:261 start_codon:yes stop_codon:yes gene_type:complete